MTEQVPIVYITDATYVAPTGASIQSLLDHYEGKEKVNIVVIGAGISEADKRRFHLFTSEKVDCCVIDFDDSYVQQFTKPGHYVTSATFIKFCIPRLLPQHDKVLYMDSDTLIQGDIARLLDYDVEGYYAAAVADIAAMKVLKYHKWLGRMRYFNAGVLLLNAKKMRQENLEKALFDTSIKHPGYLCMDQDALNDVFNDCVRYLSPQWNVMFYNMDLMKFSIQQVNSFYHTDYDDYQSLQEDAYIIHLTNGHKPWKYQDAYMAEEWMAAFRKSPFRDVTLAIQKTKKPKRSRKRPFRKEQTDQATVVYIFFLPMLQKERADAVTTLRLLGIPMARRVWTDYEIITSILGIKVFRKLHTENIKHRLDAYVNRITRAIRSLHFSMQPDKNGEKNEDSI